MKKQLTDILPLAIFAVLFLVAGIALFYNLKPQPSSTGTVTTPDLMPVFAVDGLSNEDIKGPALINFFASWCLPCKAEHPVITRLARDYPVYGIAFMDTPEKLASFLEDLGNPYKAIGQDTDGIAGSNWAVRGVPTTFAIDSKGQVIYRHDAPLIPTDTEKLLHILEEAG